MTLIKPRKLISGSEGEVEYYPGYLHTAAADDLYSTLLNEDCWLQDSIQMFGKRITPKRLYAFMGDRDFSYTYSQNEHRATPWLAELTPIKDRMNREFDVQLNCCLLNLYKNGTEYMGWHSDNEPEMRSSPLIASLSLGASRKFKLKHRKSQEEVEIMLEHGSLLIMKHPLQDFWKHALPKMLKVKEPRINLTFRTFS
ncbi:alpha-ketoglutarate-dependent dioxygenase AlkB [bacterium]|nr:alpha-ketoglutarate-dependent dioxygenase AlkB [bacterium]